jgi:hypothetical protein
MPIPCKLLEGMAGTTGLEPATSAVTGQRSNQLNYVPAFSLRGLAENPHSYWRFVEFNCFASFAHLHPILPLSGC